MKLLTILKSKLHHARVTFADPEYVGSIQIGAELMDAVGIEEGELVNIWAVDHTSRIQTYAFSGPPGTIGVNGGAAHFFKTGDRIIIAAFALTDEKVKPKIVLLNERNEIERRLDDHAAQF
jgi:aspartate 1-decarboxylase